MKKTAFTPLILAITACMLPLAACAATITGVTTSNRLIEFDNTTPNLLLSGRPITNLGPNEDILGIDYRPTTGDLYALGTLGNIYILDKSGLASVVAVQQFNVNDFLAPGSALSGVSFGFDFNPRNDFRTANNDPAAMLRIVSNTDQNLAVQVDAGTGFGVSEVTDVFYPTGGVVNIAAEAYSNSVFFDGGASNDPPVTVQYAIDSGTDMLVTQNFNSGDLTVVGPLGIDVNADIGFDIASPVRGSNFGFATLAPNGATASDFYFINLLTGQASFVGEIAGGERVPHLSINPGLPIDFEFIPVPEPTSIALLGSAVLFGFVGVRRMRR